MVKKILKKLSGSRSRRRFKLLWILLFCFTLLLAGFLVRRWILFRKIEKNNVDEAEKYYKEIKSFFYWEGYLQESTNRDLLNWTGNSNSRWQSDRRNMPQFNLGLTWDRNPNFGRNEWYTNQTFRIRSIETAREVLRWIDNGWLFLRAGFFMGAAYDDACRNNTVAVAASLRRAIERCENGEDVDVREYYTFYT